MLLAQEHYTNRAYSCLVISNVRDRILKEAEEQAELEYEKKKTERKLRKKAKKKAKRRKKKLKYDDDDDDHHAASSDPFAGTKNQLKSFLNEEGDDGDRNQHKDETDRGRDEHQPETFGSKPIADLFPAATVLFADIVGFTAWSSVREPTQVFQLLETLYHHFDNIANRRKVFKVETIGTYAV